MSYLARAAAALAIALAAAALPAAAQTGWAHGHLLWGADSFLPDGDVTSSTGTLVTKVSDTKFTTQSGVHVDRRTPQPRHRDLYEAVVPHVAAVRSSDGGAGSSASNRRGEDAFC